MQKSQSKRKHSIKASIYFVLSALFTYLFYVQYYQWIGCFNELGRCYNPDDSGIVYTTSGFVWAIPAALFFVLASFYLYRFYKQIKI